MCSPRLTYDELQQIRKAWVEHELPGVQWPFAALPAAAAGPGGIHDALPQWQSQQWALEQALNTAIANWQDAHEGVDFWEACFWHAGQELSALRTWLLQQINVNVKSTPDIQSPAEHGVGTVKRDVREQLLQFDMHSDKLWEGRQYQEFVRNAVNARLTGEAGRHHVRGSVRKLPCILKILAADAGTDVTLHYVFGEDTPGKQRVHVVKGTGGAWIRDTRWT